MTDFDKLRKHLQGKLELYNNLPKIQKMNIVLFKEAIIHVSKIYRVLNLKRGPVLLVGVGGSGKTTIARNYANKLNSKIYS